MELQKRKQRTAVSIEYITTINRMKLSNQSTKFISETLNPSISVVTKILQKVHNLEKSGIDLENICLETGPKHKPIDFAVNIRNSS